LARSGIDLETFERAVGDVRQEQRVCDTRACDGVVYVARLIRVVDQQQVRIRISVHDDMTSHGRQALVHRGLGDGVLAGACIDGQCPEEREERQRVVADGVGEGARVEREALDSR
jgi:hypothetical protein